VSCFQVVEQFEKELAEFTGAPYAVTTNTGTSAIFLSLLYWFRNVRGYGVVQCPAKTFISVPMAIKQAGRDVEFVDEPWRGQYQLRPTNVVDAALRFRRGMYEGGLQCLSFHARKILNIGEGGAVLTSSKRAADWLRAARYSGRKPPDYRPENVKMIGYQAYMTPEKAARGLHLMEYIGDGEDDQVMEYPDLRACEVFA
jgi:dTDP-4-amino-4,6-dideoxygalactose transaminase